MVKIHGNKMSIARGVTQNKGHEEVSCMGVNSFQCPVSTNFVEPSFSSMAVSELYR